MRLTGLVCTNSRNHRKTLRKIFEKHQKQKVIKIKRILITEMQANRGPIFCIFPVGGGAHPCSPRQLPHWLPDVLERQGLSLNLLSKLVMSLLLEKYLVVLESFPASLNILE